MLKTRLLAIVAVLMLVVGVMGVSAQDGTIVDVAAGNEDFSTLVSLVQAAGLADTLAGEGPYTVFAPTNEAFASVPQAVMDYLASHPDLLTQVLTYHVIDGAVTSDMITEAMSVASLDMGNELSVTTEGGVAVDGANVVIADVMASNGVIHAIDAVLVPPIQLPEVIPAAVTGEIVTAGSSTVGPLSIAIANNFAADGYSGNVSIDIIGSGGGFARFCEDGDSDIANASRGIREGEIEACGALDPARLPIEFRVGTDGIAVVVNPANDFATALTAEQLAAVFTTATTWADVDPSWPDEDIIRYIPGEASGTFGFFGEEVLDDENGEALLAASNINPNEDDNILLNGVAGNEFAIGFFGYAYYSQNQDALTLVSIDGVQPNFATVESGEYLLARPLFIYSDAGIIAEKPQVGDFINYYLTTVNDVIDEVGYFPASERTLRFARLQLLVALDAAMMGM